MGSRDLGERESSRRIAVARTAIADAWLCPDGLARAARAMADVVPGCAGMIYFREPDGAFSEIGHDMSGKLASDWASWPLRDTLERMQGYVSYRLRGPDPYIGRMVTMAEHYGAHREQREGYVREVIEPNGFSEHARLILARRGAMRAWCGVFRPRGDRPLRDIDTRRLERLVPSLRDAVRAANLTKYGRAAPGVAQSLLDQLDQPVWLVTTRGTIVHANAGARALGTDEAAAARRAAAAGSDEHFAVSRISVSGDMLALTIGRMQSRALPPSLARVADQIVRGATDKEIAAALSAPIATVRTYVRRIYERLGVRNRVQLADVWRR